jgi:FMN phosphatase YigB (HAD superfamily)
MRPSTREDARAGTRDFVAVLFDFGDTLVDEASEVKDDGITLTADLIPGAAEMLHKLGGRYLIGLVADGRQQSYTNVLTHRLVIDHFGAVVSSELAGADKPDPAGFMLCLSMLGVTPDLRPRVVMVGNRPDRDIAGANRLGMKTILFAWSRRPPREPPKAVERPDIAVDELWKVAGAIDTLRETLT